MVLQPRQYSPWNGTEKCSGMTSERSDELFFNGPEDDAVTFCRDGCPMIGKCLIFALLNNEKCGVYGGTSVDDRKAIRKQWPLRRGKIPRPEWQVFSPGEPASWYDSTELTDDEDGNDT
jgi:hypothetical protein